VIYFLKKFEIFDVSIALMNVHNTTRKLIDNYLLQTLSAIQTYRNMTKVFVWKYATINRSSAL